MSGSAETRIDFELLRGFRFVCRPDCGLCCYAEPRVELSERTALLQLRPDVEFGHRGRDSFLVARPNGGACRFLEDCRCAVHPARPHPCREYPLTVHVGRRLQATIVLSCPGVGLEPLLARDRPERSPEPEGLTAEIGALSSRVGPGTARRVRDATRRGRRIERLLADQGRWEPEEVVRSRLERQIPRPTTADFPVEDPPPRAEGMDRLPLFFDGRPGPVGIAFDRGGWEMLELASEGGARTLDVMVPPDRPPLLEPDAGRLLDGYLGHWLRRDAFFAAVELEMVEGTEGSVTEWARDGLRALGALTLARASVRAQLKGGDGHRLTMREVEAGIRAVDQDELDRPTWGDRF